jgi:hypothetical protein
VIFHVALSRPSTSSVPLRAPLPGGSAAVGVREQEVVVLRKEAGRDRRARVRARRVRDVEQLVPLLVTERAERRAQPIGDLAEACQSGPGLNVPHRGGAERGEVTHEKFLSRTRVLDAASKPRLGAGPPRRAAGAPQPARRDLDDGDEVGDRLRERHRIVIGPPARQRGAELDAGVWAVRQQRPAELDQRGRIDAPDVERRAGEASLEHGVHDRAEPQEVGRADEVQGGAHERTAYDAPTADQV